MASPSSCVRCDSPLPAGSAERLCPACLDAGDTAPQGRSETPRSAGSPDQPTSTWPNLVRVPVPDTPTEPVSRAGWPAAPPGYELRGHLGGGGMGDVFLARELATRRTVAMKFLRATWNSAAAGRFRTEVEAQAKLDHPNIVKVHFATDALGGRPFFTMEYADRGSLFDRVQTTGLLAPQEAAGLMATVARAVHYAHEQGVLHRDLKPSNILVAADDTAKVADFGLAKLLDREGATLTDEFLGTPGFMPPEQVSRKYGDFSEATDVYGLGAALYYLIAGEAPFTGTRDEILRRVVDDPPTGLRVACPGAGVSPGLDAVVMKCLAKCPADRHHSAAQLAEDLEDCAAERPPRHTLPPTRWQRVRRRARHHRRQLAAAVLVVAGVFALSAAIWPRPKRSEPPDPVAEMRKELAAGRPVTLIGATGMPKYHRFCLEPGTLGDSPTGDKTCSFHAFAHNLLELAPDPGIERYQVRLRISHLDGRPDAQQPNVGENVGFYCGYSTAPTAPDTTAHAVFALTFRDSDPKAALAGVPPGPQRAYWQKLGYYQSPGKQIVSVPVKAAQLWFNPPPVLPGPWRTIEATVTPDELHVVWVDEDGTTRTLVRWSGDRTRDEYRKLKAQAAAAAPGAVEALPEWSPRMPFGIVAFKSAVAVKDVVLTPLR